MEILYRWIDGINDVLWSYLLVALLLGCAVWFTLRTRGVQFRMLGEMVRVLGESAGSGPRGEKHVSSFQAFAVSLASRVGTGNLAGVATAIAVGGPGAVFWMWVIALLGASSAFVESTLAQLYKRKGRDSYIGGPAYYMERGLGRRWMGVLFAVLISVTFDGAGNIAGGFAVKQFGFGGRGIIRRFKAVFRHRVHRIAVHHAFLLAQKVNAYAARNAVQPAGKAAVLPILPNGAPRLQHDLLCAVHRVLAVVQIMPADAPNHLLIGCDELLKGGCIALLRAPENEFIHCRSLLVFHDERSGDFVP